MRISHNNNFDFCHNYAQICIYFHAVQTANRFFTNLHTYFVDIYTYKYIYVQARRGANGGAFLHTTFVRAKPQLPQPYQRNVCGRARLGELTFAKILHRRPLDCCCRWTNIAWKAAHNYYVAATYMFSTHFCIFFIQLQCKFVKRS